MRQASWNLCPTDIAYSTSCYDDPDNTFASITGATSRPMPDLPDGDWSLILNKDIFQKVRRQLCGAPRPAAARHAARRSRTRMR